MATRSTPSPDAWRARAACADLDPELFFAGDERALAIATHTCNGCPVRRECLETAIAHGEMHGVWGGTSETERRRMIRARRRRRRDAA